MQHDTPFSLASAPMDLTPWRPGLVPSVPNRNKHSSATAKPPLGCAPDAIKLFIGNIPKHYTEQQLLPLFESIGTVVELSITREKGSKASKGSAFLWYATPQAAEAAIQTFNMRHALPEIMGKETRPLAVRPASSKNTSAARSNPNRLLSRSHNNQDTSLSLPTLQQPFNTINAHDDAIVGPTFRTQQHEPFSFNADPILHTDQHPLLSLHPVSQPLAIPHPTDVFTCKAPFDAEPVAAPSFAPAPPLLTSLASPSPAPEHSLVIHMSSRQLLAINSHLYSVHSMSGAHVSTVPLPEGMAALHVRGSQAQVGHAQQLVMLLCEYAN